jgi:RNA polymerase sigma-70 factor, ECF subfamily
LKNRLLGGPGVSTMPEATAPVDDQLPALRRRLLRRARLVMHDVGTAEDLVQDTLLAVFEGESRRRGDAALSTWAIAILKHKIADWYRSPARWRMVQLPDADFDASGEGADGLQALDGTAAHPAPSSLQPENQAEVRQMMGVINGCLSSLPKQTRHVLMMRAWLGLETAEIAERLGLTVNNCHQILHRARVGLRGCMQQRQMQTSGVSPALPTRAARRAVGACAQPTAGRQGSPPG